MASGAHSTVTPCSQASRWGNDLNWREALTKEHKIIDQHYEDNKQRENPVSEHEKDYQEMLARVGLDVSRVPGGMTWRPTDSRSSSRMGISRNTQRLRPIKSRGSTARQIDRLQLPLVTLTLPCKLPFRGTCSDRHNDPACQTEAEGEMVDFMSQHSFEK